MPTTHTDTPAAEAQVWDDVLEAHMDGKIEARLIFVISFLSLTMLLRDSNLAR